MTHQVGRPDNQERAVYGVYNDYNLVNLNSGLQSSEYVNDVSVLFTLNDIDRWDEWQSDVTEACIRWLARSTGDALLDRDHWPILGRKGLGPVIVNNDPREIPSRWHDTREPQFQSRIVAALERENLSFKMGLLKSIDPA